MAEFFGWFGGNMTLGEFFEWLHLPKYLWLLMFILFPGSRRR